MNYDCDFNGDNYNDIKICLEVDPASNSGTEDIIGAAFDLFENQEWPHKEDGLDIIPFTNADDVPLPQPYKWIAKNHVCTNDKACLQPGFPVAGQNIPDLYDAAVQFNEKGLGDGKVQLGCFAITMKDHDVPITALQNSDFYVRLQSTNGGEGSAKTVGRLDNCFLTPTEPPTVPPTISPTTSAPTWLDPEPGKERYSV